VTSIEPSKASDDNNITYGLHSTCWITYLYKYKWAGLSFARRRLNSKAFCLLVARSDGETRFMHVAWDGCTLHETVFVCVWQLLSKWRPKPSWNSHVDFRSVSNRVGYRANSREIFRDLTGSSLCMAGPTPTARNVFRDTKWLLSRNQCNHDEFRRVTVQTENAITSMKNGVF